jgi:Peptidase family M28
MLSNFMKSIIKSIGRIAFLLSILLGLLWVLLARPALTPERVTNGMVVTVNDKLLWQHVKVLSQDYSPRHFEHIGNLNASAQYIKNQFENMGLDVKEQTYNVNGEQYKNIITNLGPETGPKIVIGAHYDVAGPHPGADDNASGVAGLIELARLLKNENLNKNITLVAYTLEEPPYYATSAMGSYRHAQQERKKGSDIQLMISLEMIGYYSEKENSQTFPLKLLNLFYPNRGNFIAVVDQFFSGWGRNVKVGIAKYMSIPVYSINAPAIIPGIDFSDHRSYWAHDYDAIMITNTSFYRNVAYHSKNDTMDRLNFEKMAEIVKGVFGYVKELSQET